MDKKLIWLFMMIGSYAGGYAPLLWGGSAFSLTGIFTGFIGGVLGIWIGWRVGRDL